mmetsp:Transcript_63876/g.202119  ORF Transcript_63876/g.202119 Transcript_63876/m.202119 type:complete len:767 (+) Transcript_63876:388-2688(+)
MFAVPAARAQQLSFKSHAGGDPSFRGAVFASAMPHGSNPLLRSLGSPRFYRPVPVRSVLEEAEAPLPDPEGAPFFTGTSAGSPEPLGPSVPADGSSGVNFSLFAKHADQVTLVLFECDGPNAPSHEVPCQRTGDHWHVQVEGLARCGPRYSYRVGGPSDHNRGFRFDTNLLNLDPYAPLVAGRRTFGQRDENEGFVQGVGSAWRGAFNLDEQFDWGIGYKRPSLHHKDLVIYEVPVRNFTADESSGVAPARRGTYLGLADKIPHLLELGVNAVELLPVHEWDELELKRDAGYARGHMTNTWGYSTMNFFSPMSRFAAGSAGPEAAAREFKEMVRRLHLAGIEVILDVVYNHTMEGGDGGPTNIGFRGIDCPTYYMMDKSPGAKHPMMNFSGCGNTVNANNPATARMIVDSLRHWVEEYHVDGFRFDLASALCRDEDGSPMARPPLIAAISKDPVLSQVKLISEPWDCGGLYLVGSFPNWDIWSEWNGRYRDDVRRFIKGDEGVKKGFATRVAGSSDLYHNNNRKPYHSVNFVIAHDGFTLNDLVSYNSKHNDANGESNNDGANDNESWNCGVEGPTDNREINALRTRQMKNFHLALMGSQGTPMVLAGDEYKQTHEGNNNTYGHDGPLQTWFQWQQLDGERGEFFRFYSSLIHFRRRCPLLGRAEFLGPSDITWHETNWDNEESKFLAYTLHDKDGSAGGDLLFAFNAHHFWLEFSMPPAPGGKKWHRIVDTNLASPEDYSEAGVPIGEGPVYNVAPWGSIMLQAR